MIVLLDTSDPLAQAEEELGRPVEQLLTPLTKFTPQRPAEHFAIDNGAYAGFNEARFLGLLERERPRQDLCRFVAAPDVVGSALRTLELFNFWAPKLKGWKLALVAQDGLEGFPVEWWRVDAVFIGGTTSWKLGRHARETIRAAQEMGKWVHVGRVNTPRRFAHFERLGVDSIDGTGLSRFSHMRRAIRDSQRQTQLVLE